MRKAVFSSDHFPTALDDKTRQSLWQEQFATVNAGTAISFDAHRPFKACFEGLQFGATRLGRFTGTMTRMTRTPRIMSGVPNDDICIGINMGSGVIRHSQNGHEVDLVKGAAVVSTNGAPADLRAGGSSDWLLLAVQRERLRQYVPAIENDIGKPLDSSKPAFKVLRSYIAMLLEDDDLTVDETLAAHIETALCDLLGQALSASQDSSTVTGLRGPRAVKLGMIIATIKAEFTDPEFSLARASLKLGMSTRYMQDILSETGTSFTERVMELRLQKARTMLADQRHDRLNVNKIAEECGFNEASYFHRCFRRRFGVSPAQYRGGNGAAK